MKPMLAAATDGKNLRYPLMASPKLDGVRCIVRGGIALSRSLKPIPNLHVQKILGHPSLEGLDGELMVGSPTAEDVYRQTMSGVMSVEGTPDFVFHIFDDFMKSHSGFKERWGGLAKRIKPFSKSRWLTIVPHALVTEDYHLEHFEAECLAAGYEGVMIRSLDGPYKEGRSTLKEGYLLKLKRFADSEAEIIGCIELMHNANEAKRNALGQLERSSHKAGKKGSGTLGALSVRDLKTKIEFEIGTGFDDATRAQIWKRWLGATELKDMLTGKIVKYKYFPGGVKDKPRFPVFLGFRNARDM